MARNLNPDFQDHIISTNQRIAKSSGSIKDPAKMSLKEQFEAEERYQEEQRDKRINTPKRPQLERFTHRNVTA